MNLATVIAVIALVAIVFFVIRYLVREKRRGNKCIGCPYAGECSKFSSCDHEQEIAKTIELIKEAKSE